MNYQFNSFVNHSEAEALKEMIFKRARERSEAMTTDLQADVMNIARESFVSNNNPFSQIAAPKTDEVPALETPKPIEEVKEPVKPAKNENIGFVQHELYTGATTQNKIIKEQMTAMQLQNTMKEARDGLAKKKSFMGALEFLNAKAAVSLLRTKTDSFEVLA